MASQRSSAVHGSSAQRVHGKLALMPVGEGRAPGQGTAFANSRGHHSVPRRQKRRSMMPGPIPRQVVTAISSAVHGCFGAMRPWQAGTDARRRRTRPRPRDGLRESKLLHQGDKRDVPNARPDTGQVALWSRRDMSSKVSPARATSSFSSLSASMMVPSLPYICVCVPVP